MEEAPLRARRRKNCRTATLEAIHVVKDVLRFKSPPEKQPKWCKGIPFLFAHPADIGLGLPFVCRVIEPFGEKKYVENAFELIVILHTLLDLSPKSRIAASPWIANKWLLVQWLMALLCRFLQAGQGLKNLCTMLSLIRSGTVRSGPGDCHDGEVEMCDAAWLQEDH
jgi:hypothetical protein